MTLAIADTSFVVSLGNQRDLFHSACVAAYRREVSVILPQPILAEVAYMVQRELGPRGLVAFLRRLPQMKYRIAPVELVDVSRIAEILDQYADSPLDFADATIVAVAERMNIGRVLTLDRRDFLMIRPRHMDYFEVLPEHG